MFTMERTRNIPGKVWMILGLVAGLVLAVAVSGGLQTSGSSDDSGLSRLQQHNALRSGQPAVRLGLHQQADVGRAQGHVVSRPAAPRRPHDEVAEALQPALHVALEGDTAASWTCPTLRRSCTFSRHDSLWDIIIYHPHRYK